jgi:signal transduction histidine kinase
MAPTSRYTPDRIAPWAVLALFLLLTGLATKFVWESSQVAERTRFDRSVQASIDQVSSRMEAHINELRAATGLFAATEDVTRDQFRAYVRSLDLARRDPGMLGIGISVRVRPEDIQAVVADLRANDFADFTIWPWTPRPEYHTVVVLEPLNERNRRVIGFDMFTDPLSRAAMERARDAGEPAATEPMHNGFLMFVPVYTTEKAPPAVEQRRDALYGFIYAPFSANNLFEVISRERGVVTVQDGDTQLFSDDLAGREAKPRYTALRRIPVAGREWTVSFASPPAPLHLSALTVTTLAGGLLISVLLFFLMRVQLRARSEAERIAETLRRSEAELQAASRAKDEFLATLSHELRTPMTAILGWSKLLTEELDTETRKVATDAIQKSSKAQAQLIDDLLDVSRITAGKMNIEPSALDLAPIIRVAVDAVSPAADAKGVTVTVDLPPKPVVINGDPNRIQQVIWNLLSNAVKFTPRGGRVEIVLSGDTDAVITVTDTGQGIEPDFLPFVFDRFRQADSSTTRSYTGLGLGLAIVRHLIELHGGTVQAESRGSGQGAHFTVRLPLLRDAVEGEDTLRRLDHVATGSLRGAKILVVDDEDDVRNYAAAVFRTSGSDVRSVRSADEALDLASESSEWKPDVIISDLGMPEKDGFELLRAIREDGFSDVPVVALTAYARPEDRERTEQAGFDAFVSKPVDPFELRQAVGTVLLRKS